MFIPRMYVPEIKYSEEVFILNKAQSHYVNTVMRLKAQDAVILFNGKEGEYRCHIVQSDNKASVVRIEDFIEISRESSLHIHLGQGLSRGDRFDYVIQKATELGVSEITPLISQKVQVKLDKTRAAKKVEHWQGIAISAAEQSGRTKIPTIHLPTKLQDWANIPFNGDSLFCSTDAKTLLQPINKPQNLRLAIGPESGWTPTEEHFLSEQQFKAYSLGPRILRTETAPVVCLAILQAAG